MEIIFTLQLVPYGYQAVATTQQEGEVGMKCEDFAGSYDTTELANLALFLFFSEYLPKFKLETAKLATRLRKPKRLVSQLKDK